jgi:uncharacterized membrane protein
VSALARVWLLAAVYAAVYFALGFVRYTTYHTGADLGLFTQSIASVFHGFSNTTEGGSHFTFHFSPILYLCAPLLLLTHSPLALTALQALAGGLALPPLFLLARRRLPEAMAVGVALVAFLYPPLAGVTFADFHENGFVAAATLWLLWAVDGRRWAWAGLFVALTLAIKEDQSVILAFAACFGAVYFLRRGERAGAIFCAATLAVALATLGLFFGVVRTLAGATERWGPLHFYDWKRIADARGSTPWWSIGRPAYFLEALVPLVFVCCLSPLFVLALPGFAECLFSHESVTYTMGTHYAAVWIPYVLAAFAFGLARVFATRPGLARGLLRTSLIFCALNVVFASPTHWGHYLRLPSAHDAALDQALARLPAALEVGTHDETLSHLGFDPNASLGLQRDPQFALIDSTDTGSYWVEQMRPILQRGLTSGRYRLVWSTDGIELYARTGAASSGGTGSTGANDAAHGRWGSTAGARASDGSGLDRGRGDGQERG